MLHGVDDLAVQRVYLRRIGGAGCGVVDELQFLSQQANDLLT